MNCIVYVSLSFILTTFEICASMSTEILYVLPDNSTSVGSCPSLPCATLSQYVLDNGTLPVVSNVEYHFLPGEHHVPANMVLKNLHNFSIHGVVSNSSSPVVLVGCLQRYVINIIDSQFVIITNAVIKHCGLLPSDVKNLKLYCCFSCKLENVMFLQYGISALNLIGKSYLNNVNLKITHFAEVCCQAILIQYTYSTCPSWNGDNSHTHIITIDKLFIQNNIKCNTHVTLNIGLYLDLDYSVYHIKILLKNSCFFKLDRTALHIESRCSPTIKRIISIENCTFRSIDANPAISIFASSIDQSIHFVNSTFYDNIKDVIKIDITLPPSSIVQCSLVNVNKAFPLTAINHNISFIKCQFKGNKRKLLTIFNALETLFQVHVLLDSLNILHNSYNQFDRIKYNDIISVTKVKVHINGPIIVAHNHVFLSIIKFQSCDILFSGMIIFDKNYCKQVMSLDTHIKLNEYTNLTFVNNKYYSKLITVERIEEPYPFCLFQYISSINGSASEELQAHYNVIVNHNYIVDRKGFQLPLQNNSCYVSFCHFTTHCKWLPSATFHNHSPEDINKQIIQNDEQDCDYHRHICHCSNSNKADCNINTLGPVYPGQMLQTNLCNMCNSNNVTILYAEVHNVNLPSSKCKIAHQSQLINMIGNHSNTVNYTIVSSTPEINKCELFLTATPFLNKIYESFYVQLLPCPIGFTLQNGLCDCDPILSEKVDNCYIDQSGINRPANTWITAHAQANTTKYFIADCPMDYCLPYSSNVSLLYPDLQCQFNRTGILCSQCQNHLSMVFGSSRCMECTNVHVILAIIIAIVAGFILVVILYLLHLTVTNGTIHGIIFYANIISINNSVFLVNNNVFKPLKVFISVVNLDLGYIIRRYSYLLQWLVQ